MTILVILVMRLIGLVTRLARPGANVTGLSFFFLELVGKWVQTGLIGNKTDREDG
ncbi:MAG TPA: hypothetical protein VGA58_10960 [bacterium]